MVLDFEIPSDVIGKRLDSVLLEFYVDASLKEGVASEYSPLIEIYPLNDDFTGDGSPSFTSVSAAVRNVKVGSGKRVLMNITDIVGKWITDPNSKHGLIIGSLTGIKSSEFVLCNDVLGGGIVARVTFQYQNRFGGKIAN